MHINVGYELVYDFPKPTPMIVMLNIHYSRASDMIHPDHMITTPVTSVISYRDSFGNWCSRLTSPQGKLRLFSDALINDSGLPEVTSPDLWQSEVSDLPEETLLYLMGSRYCETDQLAELAWDLFENAPMGWGRVQTICDYVHNHLTFSYEHANPTKTAMQAYTEGKGVCRDFAHLAITLCRCMNIPARYCSGYLCDIGIPAPHGPADFAGWFEAYLGGAWHIFDARNNEPRIGRVLIARGRDAADVAISTVFGSNTLESFKVWSDEVSQPTLHGEDL